MSIPGISINPYDELPFPSQPVSQSHPDRLAAVAKLFGLNSPPPNRCRVLELGCATGGNIIPIADRFPESEFVGIDYSRSQILIAQRDAEQLQLANLQLRHADISELDESLGQFDYIICHGVYSWVSNDLQQKILELCRKSLAPNGVAYISYNTFPGWHLRHMLREVMRSNAAGSQTAKEMCRKGRAVLEFLVHNLDRESSYGKLIGEEAETALKFPDGYIYHEYFESDNQPLYFHQFVTQISQHQLQYLGESVTSTMFSTAFGPEVEKHIQSLAFDLVAGEQHLDILRNRGLRQTLICHDNIALSRQIRTENVEGLYFYGKIEPETSLIDFHTRNQATFRTPAGTRVFASAPVFKAALWHLSQNWPRAFTLDELVDAAATLVASSDLTFKLPVEARDALAHNLVRCISGGILEFNSCADDFVTSISERPRTSRMALCDASGRGGITNRRHDLIGLDDVSRTILRYLDGQHDRAALLQELQKAVDRGDVSILVGGLPATQGEAVTNALELTLDQTLARLARDCMLVA